MHADHETKVEPGDEATECIPHFQLWDLGIGTRPVLGVCACSRACHSGLFLLQPECHRAVQERYLKLKLCIL